MDSSCDGSSSPGTSIPGLSPPEVCCPELPLSLHAARMPTVKAKQQKIASIKTNFFFIILSSEHRPTVLIRYSSSRYTRKRSQRKAEYIKTRRLRRRVQFRLAHSCATILFRCEKKGSTKNCLVEHIEKLLNCSARSI